MKPEREEVIGGRKVCVIEELHILLTSRGVTKR
jgi:hypothetical protein